MSLPLNFKISTNLIKNMDYTDKTKSIENTVYSAVRTSDRPSTNGPQQRPEDFVAPFGKPRPIKHYRKRISPYNPVISSTPSLSDIESPGVTTYRNNATFYDMNKSNFVRHVIVSTNKMTNVESYNNY